MTEAMERFEKFSFLSKEAIWFDRTQDWCFYSDTVCEIKILSRAISESLERTWRWLACT